jgi:hypothetical protein
MQEMQTVSLGYRKVKKNTARSLIENSLHEYLHYEIMRCDIVSILIFTSTLKMEAAGPSEKLVTAYESYTMSQPRRP